MDTLIHPENTWVLMSVMMAAGAAAAPAGHGNAP